MPSKLARPPSSSHRKNNPQQIPNKIENPRQKLRVLLFLISKAANSLFFPYAFKQMMLVCIRSKLDAIAQMQFIEHVAHIISDCFFTQV